MDDITHTLHGAGLGDGWDVTATAHGSTGRTFVARRDNAAVFVKLGPVHPAFERLADLGVTPPILACGDDGEGFTIFRYVEGVVPDRIWMGEHADLMVDILNVVQQDEVLTDVLASDAPVPTLGEHLAAVVARLTERVKRASAPVFQSPGIEVTLERLRTAPHPVDNVPLVPTHTDPSPPNVLVTPERTYLVDWDGIRLSDPLRDIGLLLWWFVPHERWTATLRRAWLPDAASAAAVDRVYWWSALNSLRVALWIDRHGSNNAAVRSFLEDFTAAAHHLPNPKRSAP